MNKEIKVSVTPLSKTLNRPLRLSSGLEGSSTLTQVVAVELTPPIHVELGQNVHICGFDGYDSKRTQKIINIKLGNINIKLVGCPLGAPRSDKPNRREKRDRRGGESACRGHHRDGSRALLHAQSSPRCAALGTTVLRKLP